MQDSLGGVKAKLVRAKQHLDEVNRILSGFKHGKCRIVPEHDTDSHLLVFRVHLPKPPSMLSLAIGDMLFNVRSALDHLIYQLVLSHSGNKPNNKSAFPILTDPQAFASIRKMRLAGISPKAMALVEALQPYEGRENPLLSLDKLHNVDKHRTLSIVTAVASDTDVHWSEGGALIFSAFVEGEEIRDGAAYGGIGMCWEAVSEAQFARLAKMEMHGKAAIFVAFDDPSIDSLEECRVDRTLETILNFVRDKVVPAFDPQRGDRK